MARDEDELRRRWVETWVKAGPKLEAIRRRELGEMTDPERMRVADELLQIGFRFARPRPTSGLVEQQRWFRKARHLFREGPE
jgi:hypothetical protein